MANLAKLLKAGKEFAETAAKQGKRMSLEEGKRLGYYHPISENKLKMPFNEMTSEVIPFQNVATPKVVTPEDLYGGVGIMGKGDRSGIGTLVSINGRNLNDTVNLDGGFRFMDLQDANNDVWASGNAVVSKYAKKVDEISKADKDAYLIGTLAGHPATDFNAMMTDALFEQMQDGFIPKKVAKQFDKELKLRRPEWLGLNVPESRNLLKATGELRHAFHDVVGLKQFQDAGFPDIASTRKAITDPNLLDIPNGYSGYRIGKFDRENIINSNPVLPHGTYPKHLKGKLFGTADVQLPATDWFPDFIENRRIQGLPVSGDAYAFERAMPTQNFDQKWLDGIMPKYEQAVKRLSELFQQ